MYIHGRETPVVTKVFILPTLHLPPSLSLRLSLSSLSPLCPLLPSPLSPFLCPIIIPGICLTFLFTLVNPLCCLSTQHVVLGRVSYRSNCHTSIFTYTLSAPFNLPLPESLLVSYLWVWVDIQIYWTKWTKRRLSVEFRYNLLYSFILLSFTLFLFI